MKCPRCGIEFNGNFCPNCGTALRPTVAPPAKPKASALSIWALILSIIGCTSIFGFILAIIDCTKKDGHNKNLSHASLAICALWFLLCVYSAVYFKTADNTTSSVSTKESVSANSSSSDATSTTQKNDSVTKYHVGDIYQNKYIKVIYTDCGEYTDYNQYNAPADGNKIIYATFEFENIGNSDRTVQYIDFHGYADGYEVNQSYAPDGTGLDFSVKMSAGRKGTGIVAFEVPEDAKEIEIEFSPNFWTSENVIFVYE